MLYAASVCGRMTILRRTILTINGSLMCSGSVAYVIILFTPTPDGEFEIFSRKVYFALDKNLAAWYIEERSL